MEKKKIPLPNFKNIDEMAYFFDNNSLLDVEGFEEVDEVDIEFVKAKAASPVRGVVRRKRSVRQG